MKKISLFFLCVIMYNYGNSQITKGNWLVGGYGSFNSNKNSSNDLRTTRIELAPNIGYFIANKFVAGLKSDIILQNDSYYSNGNGVKTNTYILGPFFRYYFLKEENSLNILIEGNYAYGFYNKTGLYPITNGKISQYSFLFGPVIYFNSSVGLEFLVGYNSRNNINTNIINTGIQLGLGFQIHLKK